MQNSALHIVAVLERELMMLDIFESLSCSKREDQLSEVRTRANGKKLEEGRYQPV